MDKKERGCWVDIEGHLRAGAVGKGGAELCTSQTEEGPIRDYRDGAVKDGISCSVWYEKQTGIFTRR
jgi:hypothetical protein